MSETTKGAVPQVFKVVLTAAQRGVLLDLAHSEGQKLKGQRGRVFRRFLRAFGVQVILDVVEKTGGQYRGGHIKPAVFTLTAENIEYAMSLFEVDRTPVQERSIGPVFDILEDLTAKREVEPPGADVPEFDAAGEDWMPVKVQPIEEKISEYLRSHDQVAAADIIDRGDWDRPANGTAATPKPPETAAEA